MIRTNEPTEEVFLEQLVSPEEDWPEAWFLIKDQNIVDQSPTLRHFDSPVTVDQLRSLGILHFKMNADSYSYPIKSIPWNPTEATDPRLQKIRDDRNYSYADVITVHPDHLPEYDMKIKAFFEEHIHDAEEIRFIIHGSGYFDVRDQQDQWIRIHVKKGDLITLPEGIYHRFTVDEANYIHVMRLFRGQPVWTPFNRPCEDHPSRKKFLAMYT